MPRKTTALAVVKNPDELPDWQPEVVKPTDEPGFDEEFDQAFRDLLSMHPDTEVERLEHAEAVMKIAIKLKFVRQRVTSYIGELAIAVDQYRIWENYPGCDSAKDFWEAADLPDSVVQQAIRAFKHGFPVAEKVGIPLKEMVDKGEVTGTKLRAVSTIARNAEVTHELDTDEGREQVREKMNLVLTQPSDKKARQALSEVQGKPERIPLYIPAKITGEKTKKVVGPLELTEEQIIAGGQGLLYLVFRVDGQNMTIQELGDYLANLNATDDDEYL